jgi:cysteine desulfuration protein SufE
MGKDVEPMAEEFKTKQNLISGCQSRVWVKAEYKDGRIYFSADSDAVITKGIVSLLIRVFSGQKTDDILIADTSFIDNIGLKEHLSPTRSNGLMSMLKQIKLYALAFKAKEGA